jgi:hypothetical protein
MFRTGLGTKEHTPSLFCGGYIIIALGNHTQESI